MFSVEERHRIVVDRLAEVLEDHENELEELLENDNVPTVYWGTACTGIPHFGYLVPMLKIADFLRANCRVKILFADIHAYLDNMKTTLELCSHRTEFYKFLIKELLMTVGVPIEKLCFVRGSDFQLSGEYTMDLFKLMANTTVTAAIKAGTEVVKQTKNPLMSSVCYPLLQALDEEYLQADIQLGGQDQRKIFVFARENLPALGYKKRVHLMNPLIPGLTKSGKMSSSEPQSKIDFCDSDDMIRQKFAKAFSIDRIADGNSLLAVLEHIIFPFFRITSDKWRFSVDRPDEWGGLVEYSCFDDAKRDFIDGKLSSIDLKKALAECCIKIIQPIRRAIHEHEDLLKLAYPTL